MLAHQAMLLTSDYSAFSLRQLKLHEHGRGTKALHGVFV